MPTISFDTIEHSDVTGLETTRHDYVVQDFRPSFLRIRWYKDDILIKTYVNFEAQQLLGGFEAMGGPYKTR